MIEERVSLVSTAALAVATVLGLFSDAGRLTVALVSLAMFVGGALLMAAALVIAAQRSRESVIGVGDVFFSVPKPLLFALGAQVVIGLVGAAVHPNTGAAFGILASIGGLGLCGMWGARHGTFPPRET